MQNTFQTIFVPNTMKFRYCLCKHSRP